MPTILHLSRLAALAPMFVLVGCAGGDPTASAGGAAALSVSFLGSRGTAAPTAAAAAPLVLTGAPGDTLVIARVQLVLDDVHLKRAGVTACPDSMRVTDDSRRSRDDGGCSRLDLGPTLLDLLPGKETTATLAQGVPAGTYRAMEFEIDDVSSSATASAAERAFLQANPSLRDVSVVVTGTWRGAAFTFTSRARVEMEFEFEPALVVAAGVNDNVTIDIDLSSWFSNGSGGLVAPTLANRVRIDQNILASFSAYGDRDRDGREDGGRGRGRGRGKSGGG